MDLCSAFHSEGAMVKQSWLKGTCSSLLYSPTLNANAAPKWDHIAPIKFGKLLKTSP